MNVCLRPWVCARAFEMAGHAHLASLCMEGWVGSASRSQSACVLVKSPKDRLVLCSSLYALWWCSASGRALILQQHPTDGPSGSLLGAYIFCVQKKGAAAPSSPDCIWMPAESISRVCCEITLTKTCSQLAPKFSALKWRLGCLTGK